MKRSQTTWTSLIAAAAILCLGTGSILRAEDAGAPPQPVATPSPQNQAQNQAQSSSQSHVQANSQRDIEQRRRDAEQQAEKTLDKDAISAIDETQKAVKAIAEGKKDEAIAALERATGKINLLVARNPQTALLPVALRVDVIDVAPRDVKAIRSVVKATEKAMSDRDYPEARVLLQNLISEIRVRTYNLPLATYPSAMSEAARYLDQNKLDDARTVLELALNTLVVIDHVTPLPLVVAAAAIDEAQAVKDKDKDEALRLLTTARNELDRAKYLGYAGNDPEYASLQDAISDVEKQIKGGKDSGGTFTKLKEKLSSFFKRQSASEKKHDATTS
jgi:hypothetical protein